MAALPPEDARASGSSRTAVAVVAALRGLGMTVATAESLTAGQVSAALADVPGASDVLRGGVVAYATDVKTSVLGVPEALLERTGPVDGDLAVAMARGVARLLGADLGVATTGVAGPGAHDGHPAGQVFVAVAAASAPVLTGAAGSDEPAAVRELRLPGDRAAVRARSTQAALRLLLGLLPMP